MLFRKSKKPLPPAPRRNSFDDPTSIGNVLLKLGKISPKQLRQAVGQKAQFDEALLGTLLTQMGFVRERDIAIALKIQAEMREGAALTAELDVLDEKIKESEAGAQELSDRIAEARSRRRDRGEVSGIFLIHPSNLAQSS